VEPLLNPARPKFRWWTEHWPLIWQLEQHAMALDPHLRRLPLALVDRHPGVRRYVEAWGVPPWDVIGWQTDAEGPWRQRRLVALAPRPPWQADPKVLCLDDPTDSLHRNGPLELCLYYERDPDERRWKVNDGLVRLFDLARAHVWSEHIWRRRGRKDSDWPALQAIHGYGAPARANPDLALPPVLPLTADGHPTGVPFA
jgi:hypothetical protein